MTKIFPTILIVLDLCAAAMCYFAEDHARAGYWVSAAFITFFSIIM